MKVKTSDLTQIISQASCLSERLGKQLQVTDSQQQLTSRLQRWCQVSAHGNWEKFQKRLLWDGLDIEQVQQALRSLPVVDSEILPAWAETLRAMIETASNFHPPSLTTINPQNLAFQELLLPAISVARRFLQYYPFSTVCDFFKPSSFLSFPPYSKFKVVHCDF